MRPYRVLLRGQGVFFAAQSSADCITGMAGLDLRQAQPLKVRHWLTIYETAIRTGQASTGNSYSSSHTNETHELNFPIRPDGRATQLGDGEA